MPIRTNLLERTAFYTLNAAPAPMLELAGALAYQTVSTAVNLGVFDLLARQQGTAAELARALDADERGFLRLIEALEALGYVEQKNGRYAASAMTEKWFSTDVGVDMAAGITTWDVYLRELWPFAPQVIRSGERPYNFYEFVTADPAFSHAFQQLMVGNANLTGPDIIKKIDLPAGAKRLLDVGGGHGVFSVRFCEAYPDMTATIIDSESALETARLHVSKAGLEDRITLLPGDMWDMDWQGPYNLVLLFNLLHHFDAPTNEELLRKAHGALQADGCVAVLEQVEGNVRGPATNAFVRLIALMYHLFADGRVYSMEQLSTMLQNSGFDQVRSFGLSKAPGNKLITAAAG